MVHCCLYLGVHGFLHLSLSVSPIAAQGDEKHYCKDEEDTNYVMNPVAIVEVDDTCLDVMTHIVGLEHCFTFLRSIRKSSANGIKNCLGLELATECAIVDHDRWEQV